MPLVAGFHRRPGRDAAEGSRNAKLYWASLRMYEKVRAGRLADHAAAGMLLDAALAVQLPEGESQGHDPIRQAGGARWLTLTTRPT